MECKVKYGEISTFDFQSVMEKIASTPVEQKAASHIRQIYSRLKKVREQMSEEFKRDIMAVFAKRDEKGQIMMNPHDPRDYVRDESKAEEHEKAMEAFAKREAVIEWRPLTPSTLREIKMSGKEIDSLGELYSDEEGPGVPGGVAGNPFSVVSPTMEQ